MSIRKAREVRGFSQYEALLQRTFNLSFNSLFCAILTGIALICMISSHVRSSFGKLSTAK
jgi:hypothetical protein